MNLRIRHHLLFAVVAATCGTVGVAYAQNASNGSEPLSWQAPKPKVDAKSKSDARPTSYTQDQSQSRGQITARRPESAPRSGVRPASATRSYTVSRRAEEGEVVAPGRSMESPQRYGASREYVGPGDFYGESCDDCCDGAQFCNQRRSTWVIGAEYVLVRPHFSEPVAMVARQTIVDEDDNVTLLDTTVDYEFDYESSFRVYLGYRLCQCGGELRFTYWHFNTTDGKTSGVVPDDETEIFAGHLENNAALPGQQLITNFDLTVNTYDIEFIKCIPVGCCQNDCCAPWELKWSAGVRVADVQRSHDNLVTSEEDGDVAATEIQADFSGAGPRVGLEGRRYFRNNHCWSLYGKGNMSLLLGDYEVRRERRNPPVEPEATAIQLDDFVRVIPVTEIELGGSWQWRSNMLFSVGWQWQAWWDLGMFEDIEGTNFGPQDDANIMSFDGLFVRAEWIF